MNRSRTRRDRTNQNLITLVICIVVFGVGYYILNHISKMENPFLGNTFHIIFGCLLMAISTLLFVYTGKKQFFPKKRKRTKQVFLEDIDKK